MILVLGGTTEGRVAVRTLEEAGKPFFYSTKGNEQEMHSAHVVRITGALDETAMEEFCHENVRLIIDAAHPFAVQLHRTACSVAARLHLPIIRLERTYPPRDSVSIWCDNFDDAIHKLIADKRTRLLALTGVQTINRLRTYWQSPEANRTCYFRILDRPESKAIALKAGFPADKILYYHTSETEDELHLFTQIRPDAILTKESGLSGGFIQKASAAHQLGIPMYVIRRPILPAYTTTVTGPHGLRMAIEKLLPDFYPLRSGFTSGSCATAAAKAALTALLTGKKEKHIAITLPDGEQVELPVDSIEIAPDMLCATAFVVKNAGDDPDVTNGIRIGARIAFTSTSGIHFLQGEGVGRITLPGLGLEIGSPAINMTPRNMITNELSTLCPTQGINVTIFVPGGADIAKRTFNPKLGIIGGISIIGTSGIVRPFSAEAFVHSIRREIEVCQAVGAERLVINSGARSERYLKELYPNLPPQAFVQYGNYIGDTIRMANQIGVKKITLGVMLGKAVKLAEGKLDTHSRKSVMNRDFLFAQATDCGCSHNTLQAISHITLARELWSLLPSSEADAFFPHLLALCHKHVDPLLPQGKILIVLIDENGCIRYHL